MIGKFIKKYFMTIKLVVLCTLLILKKSSDIVMFINVSRLSLFFSLPYKHSKTEIEKNF